MLSSRTSSQRQGYASDFDEISFSSTRDYIPKDTYDNQSLGKNPSANNNRFLIDLRKAFELADVEQKGWLSLDQWRNSTLRFYIDDGKLSDGEFEKYFRRIDANSDEKLTWQELVLYMIQEITIRNLKMNNAITSRIIRVNIPVPPRSSQHRDMIQRIRICKRTGRYATLSQDSIRFWDSNDLSFLHVLFEPGNFSDFYMFDYPFILVAATTDRRLVFYELEMFTILPVEICASPSTRAIKNMSLEEAENTLQTLHSTEIPLFNVPTVIYEIESAERDKNTMSFFIGDDEGYIEAFNLCVPQRRNGNDYKVYRLARGKIHAKRINEIKTIKLLKCYASCSQDGTVKFWTYLGSSFRTLREFPHQSPVSGFLFLESQKVLVTYGNTRDSLVWGINPPQKMFTLGEHYNQIECLTEFETTNKEHYIITITNRKEFKMWDSSNYRSLLEWTDPSMQRPENRFTSALFDSVRYCLITCSAYPTKLAEDFTTSVSHIEEVSHNYPIVGCFYSREYDQMVTCDAIRTIKLWEYKNGNLEAAHREKLTNQSTHITTACLDNSSRRIITAKVDGEITLWNFNSGQEIISFKISEDSLISILQCVMIQNREYLVCCRWDRRILVYREIAQCEYELYRSFDGHKNDIISLAPSQLGVVSGDADGTVIYWVITTSLPQAIANIETGGSVEAICVAGYYVYVGDSNGQIIVFSLPKLNMLRKIDSHGITRKYSLTSLVADKENDFLYSSDTLGYVRKFKLSTLEPLQLTRCHLDDIVSLTLMNHGKHIVTTGVDKTIRLWDTETFGYYGIFYDFEKDSWSTDTEEIGPNQSPFQIDQQHFKPRPPPKHIPLSINMRRQSKMKLSGRIFSSRKEEAPQLPPCIECEEDQEDPFTFQKFREAMDDMMQETNEKAQKRLSDLTRQDLLSQQTQKQFSIHQKPTQLQPTMRPGDLINQFSVLCNKQYGSPKNSNMFSMNFAPTKLSHMTFNIIKPTKRPPKRSKSAINDTFQSNRLPLSLQIM